MMITTLWLLAAVTFLAYANGANDNFKAVATVYGSKTLSYRGALTWATCSQLAGSAAALTWGAHLVKIFSGKGLVSAEVIGQPAFLLAVGLGAAMAVMIATRVGLPISTTHALVGALVGGGYILDGHHLSIAVLGGVFFLPLLISPLLAFALTVATYPIASGVRRAMGVDVQTCLCVGPRPQPVSVTPLGQMFVSGTTTQITMDQAEHCRQLYTGRMIGVPAKTLVDAGHLLSSGALGFARGLNDTPKVIGLLLASGATGLNPSLALTLLAVAMATGGVLHARQLAQTLGNKITQMNRGQGMIANLVASCLVIGASLAGHGVSTTHVSCGAIFGLGLCRRQADWKLVTGIIAAWIGTLPLAAALAAGCAVLLGLL